MPDRFTCVKFEVEVPVDHELDGAPEAYVLIELARRNVDSLFPVNNFKATESAKWQYKLSDSEVAALAAELVEAEAKLAPVEEPDNHVEDTPANDKK